LYLKSYSGSYAYTAESSSVQRNQSSIPVSNRLHRQQDNILEHGSPSVGYFAGTLVQIQYLFPDGHGGKTPNADPDSDFDCLLGHTKKALIHLNNNWNCRQKRYRPMVVIADINLEPLTLSGKDAGAFP